MPISVFSYSMMYRSFVRLYQSGPPEKIEKLRCILHYFQRIRERSKFSLTLLFSLFENLNLVPTGVISFRRSVLTKDSIPRWSDSKAELSDIHVTTDKKIEDINCVLQVNRKVDITWSRTFLS
jgi:hypothetical protein